MIGAVINRVPTAYQKFFSSIFKDFQVLISVFSRTFSSTPTSFSSTFCTLFSHKIDSFEALNKYIKKLFSKTVVKVE